MATMSWLIKDLGMRALVIYLAVIAVVALAAGIIFDAFFSAWVDIATRAELHDHAAGGFGIMEAAAVLFILMMAWALGMKVRQFMNAKGWGTTQPAPAGGPCCSSSESSQSSCGCKP